MSPKKEGKNKDRVKKTIEKVRTAKRTNEAGEEEEYEEKYQEEIEEIEIDAEGPQPEETMAGERSEEVKDPNQKPQDVQTISSGAAMENPQPTKLEERFDTEDFEIRRLDKVKKREGMSDEQVMKEEGWKLREIWDPETRTTAIFLARAGANGVTNYIKANLDRVMREDVQNRCKQKQSEGAKAQQPKRSWTSKKSLPPEYQTPRRLTEQGDIVQTAKKDQQNRQKEQEESRKVKKEIDALTERLQNADLGQQDAHFRLRLQETKMEQAEAMMKIQQKINEATNKQVRYLMKSEITEDRRKAECQIILKGWKPQTNEAERADWIVKLLKDSGFIVDTSSYSNQVTNIQNSNFRGFSPLSIVTFSESWHAKKFLHMAKSEKMDLRFYTSYKKQSWESQSQTAGSWETGWAQKQWKGDNSRAEWEQGQWGTQKWEEGDDRNKHRGKEPYTIIKVAQQLSKFDRNQQFFLRAAANVFTMFFNKPLKLTMDWKLFGIWTEEDCLGGADGNPVQICKLVFSRDGEVGVFTSPQVNDCIPLLFNSAMNLAKGKTKFTWEREEWEGNPWEKKGWEWEDQSKIGLLLSGRQPNEFPNEQCRELVKELQKTYEAMDMSERNQYPWVPYFATIDGNQLWNDLESQGDKAGWVQEAKDEWDDWKWEHQGKVFKWEK